MKNEMKKNILSRVALLTALITVTGAYAQSEHATTMKDLATFILDVDRKISDFFSQNNKTPFGTYVIALEQLFSDFKRKVEEIVTRNNNSELAKDINDLIDYALRQFTIAHNIIKKYNGKPSSEAAAFGAEIKRDFNTERVFSEILTRLNLLKCKAKQAGESSLIKKIDAVISMIETKKKTWGAKSDLNLFAGLSYRMSCK